VSRESLTEQAEELSLRVAQVAHALMEASTNAGGGPLTAAEVCEYDGEALSVHATAAALTHARRLRLADRFDGLWFPTNKAWELRRALEDRVLGEPSTR
jgi:hypothetical protein